MTKEKKDKALALISAIAADHDDSYNGRCRPCLALEELAEQKELVREFVAECRAELKP